MPELPEVETVRRGLEPVMRGQRILRVEARRPDLRFPFPDRFAARLTGQRVEALGRRGKYLILALSGGEGLIMHLGMSGRFTICSSPQTAQQTAVFKHKVAAQGPDGTGPHDHVLFDLENGARIVFTDPRRFGFMDLVAGDELETCRHLLGMGPEPLGNDFSAALLADRFRGRRAPLKALLLDQATLAGLGNIYVCEALFRAGLSPRRMAASLVPKSWPARGQPGPRLERLAKAIRDVLLEAIAAGGSTLRDYAHADGELGYFQHGFKVYDRENQPCLTPHCHGHIKRIVQSGRSTFYCPSCQR